MINGDVAGRVASLHTVGVPIKPGRGIDIVQVGLGHDDLLHFNAVAGVMDVAIAHNHTVDALNGPLDLSRPSSSQWSKVVPVTPAGR